MKTIIAGGRDYRVVNGVQQPFTEEDCRVLQVFHITEVVCGMAPGADACGKLWAESRGIPVKEFKADWATFGKVAGPVRNRAMAQYADALIAFWDGKSRGTKNMIEEARARGLKVFVEMRGA